MRKVIFLICFLMFSFQAFAQEEITPIQAGVQYNEATARVEAFRDVEQKLDKDFLKQYLKDPNKKINIVAIKSKIYELDNRSLHPFQIKSTLAVYAVKYNEIVDYVFYYNILGSLIKVDKIGENDYPRKIYGYSRYGNLISVAFEVNEDEHFIYDENGKLIAHWQGDIAYDENDKLPKVLRLNRER